MAQLNGQLFIDLNGNGSIDADDTGAGLENWTVFIDVDGSGSLTAGDISGLTDSSGNYSITGISIGTYSIGVLDNTGNTFLTTFPGAENDYYLSAPTGTVTFTRGVVEKQINFETSSTNTLSDNLIITKDVQPWAVDGFRFWTDNNNNDTLDSIEDINSTLFLEKTNRTSTDSGNGFVNDFRTGPFGPGRTLRFDTEQSGNELETYFLRGGGLYSNSTIVTFLTEYTSPAISGSGTLWDIDTTWNEFLEGLTEKWKVEFLSADNVNGQLQNVIVRETLISPEGQPVWVPDTTEGINAYNSRVAEADRGVLQTVTGVTGWLYNPKSLDAKAWEWSFDRPQADINFVKFTFIGEKRLDGDVGFAFDKFKTYSEDIDTKDIGVFEPATIGDYVWSDDDGDGIQDDGEAAVAGVTVTLLDENNNPIGTDITDANGEYSFNVAPGTYSVQFSDLPTEFTGFTTANVNENGNDNEDNDANPDTGRTGTVTVESGETNNTLDAGLVPEPPQVLPVSIGNFVWEDSNGDGVQDPGEPGISGVTVNLLNSDGTLPITSDITDTNGFYEFDNLPPGTYSVSVIAPSGYTATATGQGGDPTKDSNNPNGSSTTLPSGGSDQTIDFGFYRPASIGNFVWLDGDGDGVQDTGESGISGVTVNLLGSNGTTVITSDTTDTNGFYEFTNLAPGVTYYVQFVQPSGMVGSTTPNVGNDATDSDAGAGGLTGPIVLTSGQYNDTIDAGFLAPPPPTQYKLGDKVWSDTDQDGLQDTGEAGIDGITVRLLDSTGTTVLQTTTTQNGGFYSFTVNNGTYRVEFAPSTSTYGFTQANIGGNDGIDSDADVLTGRTGTVTINGSDNLTVDAGLYRRPTSLAGFTIGGYGLKNPNGAGRVAAAGYSYTSNYETVFSLVAPPALPSINATLRNDIINDYNRGNNSVVEFAETLDVRGNSTSENLLRQSTAALLNASATARGTLGSSSSGYYFSIAEVIAYTRSALSTTGYSDDNQYATWFDNANNGKNPYTGV